MRKIPHLPALDGVRAVAILLVLCVHFCQLYPAMSSTFLWRVGLAGQTGVDLFFVLSGFLITRILLADKGDPHFLKNFYARRTLRIFPLYYVALLGVYLIWPALHIAPWVPARQSFWFWLYLQDYVLAFQPALQQGPNHFWSLAVEEHFYLLWPFVVLRLSGRHLYRAVAAAITISLLTRILWANHEMYYFTLARLDGLAIGSAIAIFAASQPRQSLARALPWAKGGLLAFGAIMLIPFLLPHFQLSLMRIIRSTLIAGLYASALVLLIENRLSLPAKLLSSRPLRSIGKYSYAMYIFHPFIFGWLRSEGVSYSIQGLLVGSILTYLASWISWNILEKHMLSYKRFFKYDPPKSPPSDPPLTTNRQLTSF